MGSAACMVPAAWADAPSYSFLPTSGTAEWTAATNWSGPGGFPDAPGVFATLQGGPTQPLTVDVAAPVTVGYLHFGAYGTSTAGTNTLQSSNGGSITFVSGPGTSFPDGVAVLQDAPLSTADAISADLYLASPALWVYADAYNTTLTLSSTIADAPGTGGHEIDFFSNQANGTLLSGNNTFTGPMNVEGTVKLLGQATGWGQTPGVNVTGTLGFVNANPARAVPITLSQGGAVAGVATATVATPTTSTIASPITVVGSGVLSVQPTTYGSTNYAANLTLTGAITGTNANLALGDGKYYRAVASAAPITSTVTVAGPLALGNGTVSVPTYAKAVLASPSATFGMLAVYGGALAITGNATASLGTNFSSGSLQIGNGGTTGQLDTPTVTEMAPFTASINFDRADAFTFAAAASGLVNLLQSGSGTTTLSGTNALTGNTLVTAGGLRVAPGSSLGTGVLTIVNTSNVGPNTVGVTKTVELDNAAQTVSMLTGAVAAPSRGTNAILLELAGGTALTVNQATSSGFAGGITGPGSLTKTGPGNLALSGPCDYAGPTTVSAGVPQMGANGTSGTLAPAPVMVAAGAGLTFDRTELVPVANLIAGGGTVSQLGTGTLDLTRTSNTYAGGTHVSTGTLRFAAPASLGTGPIGLAGGTLWEDANAPAGVINAAVTLTMAGGALVSSGGALTFAGPITGPGMISKGGAGTVTWTGAATIGGSSGTSTFAALYVGAGSLVVTGAAASVTATGYAAVSTALATPASLTLAGGAHFGFAAYYADTRSAYYPASDFVVGDPAATGTNVTGSLAVRDAGTTLDAGYLYVGKGGLGATGFTTGTVNQTGGTVGARQLFLIGSYGGGTLASHGRNNAPYMPDGLPSASALGARAPGRSAP